MILVFTYTCMYIYIYIFIYMTLIITLLCKLLSSGVIKHGWLENPRTEWRFQCENHWEKWWICQQAMFVYRRVTSTERCSGPGWRCSWTLARWNVEQAMHSARRCRCCWFQRVGFSIQTMNSPGKSMKIQDIQGPTGKFTGFAMTSRNLKVRPVGYLWVTLLYSAPFWGDL